MELSVFQNQAKLEAYSEPVFVEREADYALAEHSHPFDAFALITQGCFEIAVAGVFRVYKTGETFRLTRNTLHTERCIGGAAAYWSARKA